MILNGAVTNDMMPEKIQMRLCAPILAVSKWQRSVKDHETQMNADSQTLFFIVFISLLLVGMSTGLHLILFRLLVYWQKRIAVMGASHVAGAVLAALSFHLLEIALFALGLVLLTRSDQFGRLEGVARDDLPNYFYYSTVTYTTLGFGDIIPSGPVRFVTAFESLTGIVLAAWTASIIYSWVIRVTSARDKTT